MCRKTQRLRIDFGFTWGTLSPVFPGESPGFDPFYPLCSSLCCSRHCLSHSSVLFRCFPPHLLNCKPMTSQQRVWSVATTLPGATLQCCRNNNNTATDTRVLSLRLIQLCVLLGHIQRSVSYSNLDLYIRTANHTFAHAFT